VERSFAPGAVLWRAGSEPRGLFLVLEGEVRVVRPAGPGRQLVIHREAAGGTLGEVPLFGGGRYPATAVASRRTVCLVLSRQAIAAAVREDPELAFRLLAGLGARIRTLIGRLDALAAQSVAGRLAAYLLARHGQAGEEAGGFALGCTQQELAEELGTVREVVVRALRTLREEGIIAAERRNRFRVLDSERLRALAGG
jgi:CRP/FNR family transcriptional regulator, dissimilatory nitrate respiration regulator